VPACRSLDTVSVFAPSVDEALGVLRVIMAYDIEDPYSRAAPFAHLRRARQPPSARLASVETVDISLFLEIARLLADGPWVAERTAALRDVVEQRPDILHPVTRTIVEGGLRRHTVDAFDAFHRLAEARRAAELLFRDYDALLLPTTPFCPSLADVGATLRVGADGPATLLYIPIAANHSVLPELSVVPEKCTVAYPEDVPIGVTLIGPAWSEGRLAAYADAIHRANVDRIGATHEPLPPPAEPDALCVDETALFCIGAHMSGLPLNHQLTGLGGRFLRTSRTTP
jgi:allophanate hydrolase